jgi:hypothetical protein
VSLACGSLEPGRRTDTTHGRGHGLYCTTHTPSCGRDHTTTINYCESRVLDQMPAACLQRQEGSPWLQSATTAAQLISKPSRRDGPQPGYRLEQLCAAAHPGRPRPHRALLLLFRRLMSAYCFPEVRSPCSILVSEILGILAPTIFSLLRY